MLTHGVVPKISLSTAHEKTRLMIANVRLAPTGAPRATMPSSNEIISRRVMSLAFRCPKTGITSFRKIRSSSAALLLFGFAHFSRYSSTNSVTVSAPRSAMFASTVSLAGSRPSSSAFMAWACFMFASTNDILFGPLPYMPNVIRRAFPFRQYI